MEKGNISNFSEEVDYLNFIEVLFIISFFFIGSTDFTDIPFISKIKSLSDQGITVVAAVGNDGPYHSTVNNPADLPEVLAVGSLSPSLLPSFFSSRGLTWEISYGMGRPKPDIVTFGEEVRGVGLEGGCEIRSGTSVSTGVVSGVLGFFLKRRGKRGVAKKMGGLKIIAMESAQRIRDISEMEQGAGKMDVEMMERKWGEEIVAVFPKKIEIMGKKDEMSPFSMMQMYEGGRKLKFNLTFMSQRRIINFPKNPNFTYTSDGNSTDLRPRINISIEFHQSSAFYLLLSLSLSLLPSFHSHSYLHSTPSVSSPASNSILLTIDLSSFHFSYSNTSNFLSPSPVISSSSDFSSIISTSISSILKIPIEFE